MTLFSVSIPPTPADIYIVGVCVCVGEKGVQL